MIRRLVWIVLVSMALAACAGPFGSLKTATFIVRAVDENNHPVPNAEVWADFIYGYKSGWTQEKETYKVPTDTNGLCRMEGRTSGTVDWEIGKDGYYATYGPRFVLTNSTLTHWLPMDREYNVVLRPVLNPIPMFAKRVEGLRVPAFNQLLGYDLEKADWLPPHGNGHYADFLFNMDCRFDVKPAEGGIAFDATLTLTFSNEDDGILEFPDPQPEREGSIFRLPRSAPETGYVNRWQSRRFVKREGSSYGDEAKRANLNYFFRVRTRKDSTGKIISAHYGKIRKPLFYGIASGNAWIIMTYYFNPTPMDRNLEFDPSRNLFTGLKPTEQVNDP